MNVVKSLFQRNLRKNDIHFTEVTVLSPGAFSHRKCDLVGFTDTHIGQNTTVALSGDKRVFRECRVSPMRDMVDIQPVYTKEDLKRIADMFLVSYTHCNNEDELSNIGKKEFKKTVSRGQKIKFKKLSPNFKNKNET